MHGPSLALLADALPYHVTHCQAVPHPRLLVAPGGHLHIPDEGNLLGKQVGQAGHRGQGRQQRLGAHGLKLRHSGQDQDPAAHKGDTEECNG